MAEYKRILLKLSGESLAGENGFGISPTVIQKFASEIADLRKAEPTVEIGIVIGGGNIYQQFLPMADCLYLTFIDLDVDGDTKFPDWKQEAGWTLIEQQAFAADDKNPHPYQFVTLKKNLG